MPAWHLIHRLWPDTQYISCIYIALISYNLLALHNQNATQQLFDFQNQLRSNVAVIAEQVKER